MLEKLQSLEDKYQELTELLSQPDVISDQARYQKYAKANADLTEIVTAYREYKSVLQQLADTREELASLQESQESLEHNLSVLLLLRDPDVIKASLWK